MPSQQNFAVSTRLRSHRGALRGGTVPMLDLEERSIVERIVAKDGLKFAFILWLVLRLVLSVWGAVVMSGVPAETYQHLHETYHDLSLPGRDLHGSTIGVWNIYDADHYTTIAEHGYEPNPGYLTAFFPGFPLLIKLGSIFLFNHYLLAAILVANICALLFFWYLYRLVEADYGEKVAKRAVIISAVFPTSFFLFMPYTEAPLLAFTTAAIYYGRQQKWWLAGVLAGAAALVKQPGVFLIIPLGYMYLRQYMSYKKETSLRQKLEWLWLLLAPIAALGYTLYRYFIIQTPLNGATDLGASEQLQWPGQPLLNALRVVRWDNPLLAANLMEIGFTILLVALVAGVVLKMRSTTYSLYSVVLAIVSLCVAIPDTVAPWRPESDMPRRALIVFPIFIFLALVVQKPRVFAYLTGASFVGFLCLSGLFVNWFFVS